MQLAIFHYHLNRGGVTSVIFNHLRALATCEASLRPTLVVLVHGGRADRFALPETLPFPVRIVECPQLDYDEISEISESAAGSGDLSADLTAAMHEAGLVREQAVLHFHNPALGKNARLPAAVCRLAEGGWRVLSQIHDFAEDLRPENYRRVVPDEQSRAASQASLYPQANHIGYATLTSDVHSLLQTCGFQSTVTTIPNPVAESIVPAQRIAARQRLQQLFSVEPSTPYVIYPVRGIRRKNLGELLLWALMHPKAMFAVTLRPRNPIELNSFESWEQLARELEIPVQFGTGDDGMLSLAENYAAADAVITTSVAEGFGLVFLESKLAGKPLIGRRLPVLDDFESNGLSFPRLATEVRIPNRIFNESGFESRNRKRRSELRASFGAQEVQVVDDHDAGGAPFDSAALGDTASSGTTDFGRLDRVGQVETLKALAANRSLVELVRNENSCLGAPIEVWDSESGSSAESLNTIQTEYGHSAIGRELQQVYFELIEAVPGPVTRSSEIAERILNQFLNPESLFPIRLDA